MESILEVENITKRFGGLVALDKVSFKVYKNEILGLIGPNGAGKTTLFNIISGLYRPDEGRIIYLGKYDLTKTPPHEIPKLGIGRTFQVMRPLSNLTVIENVMVSAFLRRSEISDVYNIAKRILERVGLYEKRFLKASLLNTVEKKRLELAKALAIEPRLLLLDEVAAGLNPVETSEFLDLLKSINREGVSIIMVEHVMRAVMNISNRIVVLHYGKKIAEGAPQDIATNTNVIEAYLGGAIV
jgi:branched-chain amino acid transport system ATP-binding protein